MGKSRGKQVETYKNENGVELRTREKVEGAFRKRLMRTFSISEEDNEGFCEEMERRVTRWVGKNGGLLKPSF